MSRTTSVARPQPEPSPPASPSPSDPSAISGSKKVAPKHLPASPPTSASSSPAHVSAPLSRHAPSVNLQTMPAANATAMSTSTSDPQQQQQSTTKLPSIPIPPKPTKHRLEDEEDQDEPNKRRRTDHDRMEPNQTNDVVEEKGPDRDTQTLFRLSTQPVPKSNPHPTDDLFTLYDLDDLANSVRRKDPITGDKINKLRKSYEGKIKEFPGKNKPVVREGDFFYLLNYPDLEWSVEKVQGKELDQTLSSDEQGFSDDMNKKLDSTLAGMISGPLPQAEREKWRPIIDAELPRPKEREQATLSRNPSFTQAGPSPTDESLRPRRRGTKRNYNDEAFEGYNEGFADDADDGSVDGDDDRRSSLSGAGPRKKRRKDIGSGSHFPGSMPHWAPGAVSVGHGR